MTKPKKIDQAMHILEDFTLLNSIAQQMDGLAKPYWDVFDETRITLQIENIRVNVMRDKDFEGKVKFWLLWSYCERNQYKVMGRVDAATMVEILKAFFCAGEHELERCLLPLPVDEADLRYLGELTGQDFIGYHPGDKVLYVPNHATGPEDTVCERGVVSSVEGAIGFQKVWVKFKGDTGQLTPLKNLRRI